MGKGVRTALLCLVFVVFAAGGYVLGGLFTEEKPVEEVVTAPVLSPVPVVSDGGITVPKRASDGTFAFTAQATVESGDQLMYVLWADETCTQEVQKNLDGNFTKVPASVSETYCLRVQNLATGDCSPVILVKGFAKPKVQMYRKITEEELYSIFEKGVSGTNVEKGFEQRLADGFKIVATNLKEDDFLPRRPEDIYGRLRYDQWTSVTIAEPLTYDQQGRLIKLVITIEYPL